MLFAVRAVCCVLCVKDEDDRSLKEQYVVHIFLCVKDERNSVPCTFSCVFRNKDSERTRNSVPCTFSCVLRTNGF